MEIKELAQNIYNLCKDMEHQDYIETEERDVNALEEELQFLKENGYDTLISALDILTEIYVGL